MVVNAATPFYSNYNLINNISNLLFTKFEKIDITLSQKLNDEEIKKILLFFENNYIVGKEKKKMKDIKEFYIKVKSTFRKDEEKTNKVTKQKIKKGKDDESDDEKKIHYTGIILLNNNINMCLFR